MHGLVEMGWGAGRARLLGATSMCERVELGLDAVLRRKLKNGKCFAPSIVYSADGVLR